jgi:hypothetical protein
MTSGTGHDETGSLVLGWQVNPTLAPRYWLDPTAKPGSQSEQDLVRVPAEALGSHTAIVAQSGSGKSFFLGRLVEEILLETKARCIIFDPNADFRRIAEVVPADRWNTAKYDYKNARGHLPHEASAQIFAARWQPIRKKILGGPVLPNNRGVQLRLPWPSLSVEFLAEDVEPMLRSDLYHCHEFVKALAFLLELSQGKRPGTSAITKEIGSASVNLIDEASRLLRVLSALQDEQDRKSFLENEFRPDVLSQTGSVFGIFSRILPLLRMGRLKEQIQQKVATAAAAVEYVPENIAKYYFGRAREYVAQHIVKTEIGQLQDEVRSERLQVIDLPSFADQKTRPLVLNSVLTTIWETARADWAQAVETGKDERVPTFIVIDEAHNLIPSEVRGLGAEALREQFRAVAAEGRKYGLFLIVCTQRPDKIDPIVLSECENIAIMKLGSRSVLEKTQTLLGLEDVPSAIVRKCLEFETGRAIIIGRWSKGGPQILYSAMRRTIEGGTSLREGHWAIPTPPESAPAPDEAEKDKSAGRATSKRSRKKRPSVASAEGTTESAKA